jgi:hypothetical protein
MPRRRRQHHSAAGFLREHSLSLSLFGILVFWMLMYRRADPSTHLGAFYGNAIADWLGSLVFIVATKYFFEVGSKESRRPHPHLHVRVGRFIVTHSLTIVLVLTGAIWAVLFARSGVDSKPGEVLGNIVSEWTQIIGLVVISKYTREVKSKEDG